MGISWEYHGGYSCRIINGYDVFFFWWGLQVGSQSWDVWNISFCLVFSPRDTDISPDDIRYCRVEIL